MRNVFWPVFLSLAFLMVLATPQGVQAKDSVIWMEAVLGIVTK